MKLYRNSAASPWWRRIFMLLFVVALAALAEPVLAQQCQVDARAELQFGTVDNNGGQVTLSLPFRCTNFSGQPMTFVACLFVGGADEQAGAAHRRMVNGRGEELAFDLYSDAAGTQVIGPAGSGYPDPSTVLRTSGNDTASGTIRVYGRIPSGQNPGAASVFRNRIDDAYLRYVAAPGDSPPSRCEDGAGARAAPLHLEVTALVLRKCDILAASDLDFGNIFSLNNGRDGTSIIALQCPAGTVWRVGLDEGKNFDGSNRRMRGQGKTSLYITYELYQDPGHSQPWGEGPGNDTSNGVGHDGVQTLTVYGRIPAQVTPGTGPFTDRVTITLTY
jgi:spore coat protein U-like protein